MPSNPATPQPSNPHNLMHSNPETPATQQPAPATQQPTLDILYEDDALLFVNKPAGIVVQR